MTCQPGLAPKDSNSKKPHKQTGKAPEKHGGPVLGWLLMALL